MKTFMLVIALFALPICSYADSGEYRYSRSFHKHPDDDGFWDKVNHRLDRQFNRIERGIHEGELTRKEAKKLHRQHVKLDKRINRIRHKHWFDYSDRRKVMAHLDETSDKIHRLKHNDRYVRRDHYHHTDHFEPSYGNDRHIIWSSNAYSVGLFSRF